MPAISKVTHLTWTAAKCCEAARKVWRRPDFAVEDIATPQRNTGGPVAEAIDLEKRLRLLFSAGF